MKTLREIWYKQLMYKRKETCTRFQASLYMSSYDNIYKFLIPIFDQNKKEETSIISTTKYLLLRIFVVKQNDTLLCVWHLYIPHNIYILKMKNLISISLHFL